MPEIQYVPVYHKMNGIDCLAFSIKRDALRQLKAKAIPFRASDCILANGTAPKPWQQIRCSTCNQQFMSSRELYTNKTES